MSAWPAVPPYEEWRETCDTLHAHLQVLGKLGVVLGPPEPQLQHAALRTTARGVETLALPAPDGSGSFVAALDLHAHAVVIEHSAGTVRTVPLAPDRAVGVVTREVLEAVRDLAGAVEINPAPQEVQWTIPLDEDDEHARYAPEHVETWHAAAIRASHVLSEFRAPYRGRSTPVNTWWGSNDLSVNLFSGAPAEPPSDDFIMRNSMDAEEVAVGWWTGDGRYGRAAFFGYVHPAPDDPAGAALSPAAARWEPGIGLYLLDWDDARSADDPHATALEFARSVFRHGAAARGWDTALAASVDGVPPPVH
jgi:Family of unknown function (DUF5996)